MKEPASKSAASPDRSDGPTDRWTGWLRFFAGVGMILLVMFGIGPMVLQLPWYGEMHRFIDSEDIRSTAIYYTDLETFSSAEFALRQNMEYTPSGRHRAP